MTQQDIVDYVNHLSVGYQISWQDIKFDADKAILKINSYMGANYPLMSEVLTGPQTSYTLRQNNMNIPIFPDMYIINIVVPYIASEILARDEEFTTIYNKYTLEVEENLFLMFSNEFNRVPVAFRQSDTTGVFFGEDTPQRKVQQMEEDNLPEFKFRIYYKVNNPNIKLNDNFVIDTNEYDYGSTYTVKSLPTKVYYNYLGDTMYTCTGWFKDTLGVSQVDPGTSSDTIKSDVVLYAQWKEESTMSTLYDSTNAEYSIRLKEDVTIEYLSIPRFIDGKRITIIDSNLFELNNSIKDIVISDTITTIKANTFNSFTGRSITFPKTGTITIEDGGLNLMNSDIKTIDGTEYSLVLTKAISKCSLNMFGGSVTVDPEITTSVDKIIDVYIPYNTNNLPTDWSFIGTKDYAKSLLVTYTDGSSQYVLYKFHYAS